MSVKVQITYVRLEEGEKKKKNQSKGASTQSGAIYYSRFLRHAGPFGFRFRFITFYLHLQVFCFSFALLDFQTSEFLKRSLNT